MNTDIQESACKHFDFLKSDCGFSRTETARSHVRFENDLVFFDITADIRDGICVDFGRFDAPSILPQDKSERLSLNTFCAALKTYRGTLKRISDEQELQEMAEGLKIDGLGLIIGNAAFYELTRQLRFWHVGDWVNAWGKSIVMTPKEIQKQKQLLPSIEKLISEIRQLCSDS